MLLRILRKQKERLAAIIRAYLTLDHNKLSRLADLQSDFYYLRSSTFWRKSSTKYY